MPRIKGIFVDRKHESNSKLCDACNKPRSILITIGENYIRVCSECAAVISDKLQKSLEKEPEFKPNFKKEEGAGKFTFCSRCLDFFEIGKSHSCSKKRQAYRRR